MSVRNLTVCDSDSLSDGENRLSRIISFIPLPIKVLLIAMAAYALHCHISTRFPASIPNDQIMSSPASRYQLRPKRLNSFPPFLIPSHNKHQIQFPQVHRPVSYIDSYTILLSKTTNFSGPLGLYNHIVDPAEERYCESPEPISRERGGDLDLSGCRVRLRRMMRMVKREEMRREKKERLEKEERR